MSIRRLLVAACAATIGLAGPAGAESTSMNRSGAGEERAPVSRSSAEHSVDWVLVKLLTRLQQQNGDGSFAPATGRAALDALIARRGVHRIDSALPVSMNGPRRPEALRRLGLDRLYRFHVPAGTDIRDLAATLTRLPGVEYAEPDHIDRIQGSLFPNDLGFSSQWGFHQVSDADVDGPEAWALSVGEPVVLAVIDTGVDTDHPDLAAKLVAGYDFVHNDPDPEDDNGHGSGSASIAAAVTDNGFGMAGACWNCGIMPLKTLDQNGDGLVSWFVDAVIWATDHGAGAINYSAGGPDHSLARLEAVRYAHDAGVVIVPAVGNTSGGIGFPARYNETIGVGGSTPTDERWENSGSGRQLDLIAPADQVLGADLNGGFQTASGTSFATPLVTGLVGLIKSVHPSVGREEVRFLVRSGAEDQVGLPEDDTPGWDLLHGFGRANMHLTLLGALASTTLRVDDAQSTRLYLDTPNPLATSYDFIRGDLDLLVNDGGEIALGDVVCLENNSPDPDTTGNEDTATPPAGEGFFYLARFNSEEWPGSYGGSSAHRDRVPSMPASAADWIQSGLAGIAVFGSAVGTAGDVDNDGFDDLIVGAPMYPVSPAGNGAAFLYRGSATGLQGFASWNIYSNQQSSGLGVSVSTAGDLNNDGFDDVAVGENLYDGGLGNNEGRVHVFLGSAHGLNSLPQFTLTPGQSTARFGFRVRPAGDVNNDGFDDLIVGAPRYSNGENNEGRVFVYHGSPFGMNTTPAWTFESGQEGARVGQSVGTAGDVNNDGYDDVIVGASLYDNGFTDQGRAWLFLGSTSGLSPTPAAVLEVDVEDARFGFSTFTAGDVDGDDHDDVLVVAARYANGEVQEGATFLYRGTISGIETTPFWVFETNQRLARVAHAETAGDVDNDGFDDILVGSDFHHLTALNEGRAWYFPGSAAGPSASADWTDRGTQTQANFGGSVVGAGDVNNDGFADVAVGAGGHDGADYNQGRVYVYYGSATGLTATPVPACDQPTP